MKVLLELCKRRGFLFPSAEIHGGLRGAYDYGPLGVELKRNILSSWYRDLVYGRDDVVGTDTGILTPAPVFQASGHLSNFTDDLVDCLLTRERFRPDKAPPLRLEARTPASSTVLPLVSPDRPTAKLWEEAITTRLAPGAKVTRQGNAVFLYPLNPEVAGSVSPASDTAVDLLLEPAESGQAPVPISYHGYAEPHSNSPFLTAPRAFNLMLKSFVDPIDPIETVIQETLAQSRRASTSSTTDYRQAVDAAIGGSTVFLRPETAQGVFMNYQHIQRTTGLQPPFGIAQVGKAFRNELRVEHAIFRTLEFEQLELEYFVPPTNSTEWFSYWRQQRLRWWLAYARQADRFRLRDYEKSELAHYASGCTDVEFQFPWGWDELEGVAHRGDFDLRQHFPTAPGKASAAFPHCIESSAGLNRALLALLVDALDVVPLADGSDPSSPATAPRGGNSASTSANRNILRLHPHLAPYKAAIMPLVAKPELLGAAQELQRAFRKRRIPVRLEPQSLKIGKRYYRHDEIGTPWCITVDYDTLSDRTVTIRDRDTTEQTRVRLEDVPHIIQENLAQSPFTFTDMS